MKIYQDIKDLEIIILELQKELPYQKFKNKAVERINKLIDVRNNYFDILSSNFYFSSLDTLILSNVILRLKAEHITIPNHKVIEQCFKEVFSDISNGCDLKYSELESMIINGIELREEDYKLLVEKNKKLINKSITGMLDTLKTDMQWKKIN